MPAPLGPMTACVEPGATAKRDVARAREAAEADGELLHASSSASRRLGGHVADRLPAATASSAVLAPRRRGSARGPRRWPRARRRGPSSVTWPTSSTYGVGRRRRAPSPRSARRARPTVPCALISRTISAMRSTICGARPSDGSSSSSSLRARSSARGRWRASAARRRRAAPARWSRRSCEPREQLEHALARRRRRPRGRAAERRRRAGSPRRSGRRRCAGPRAPARCRRARSSAGSSRGQVAAVEADRAAGRPCRPAGRACRRSRAAACSCRRRCCPSTATIPPSGTVSETPRSARTPPYDDVQVLDLEQRGADALLLGVHRRGVLAHRRAASPLQALLSLASAGRLPVFRLPPKRQLQPRRATRPAEPFAPRACTSLRSNSPNCGPRERFRAAAPTWGNKSRPVRGFL